MINYLKFSIISTLFCLASCCSTPEKEELRTEPNYDEVIAMLDTIYENDQKYRNELDTVASEFGWESDEMASLWQTIRTNDSLNLIEVTQVLDTHGWLGSDDIGAKGNATLFLVIQHSDQKTQEKYLPMMRDAVEKGNAEGYDLALLEDRVALGKGDKQIYGSQIGMNQGTGEYFVLPLIDPHNVDERRESVGLTTMAEYVSYWDMEWDPDVYEESITEQQ